MGSIVGKTMEEQFKKQQDFMLKTQDDMIERQIQMQNQMRERQAAMMIARSRDLTMWIFSFATVAAVFGIIGARRLKKPTPLVPLIPILFIGAYQADLAYGDKMVRCREEANRILENESHLIQLPHNLPTIESIDAGRNKSK